MAPKFETDPTKLSKLINLHQSFKKTGIPLSLPNARSLSELLSKIRYWHTVADIYPRTTFIEVEKGEYLHKGGIIMPIDLSRLSENELLDQVVPHELLVAVDEIITRDVTN